MKRKIGALQIVPLVCMAIGIVFLVMSLKFGFWVNEEGKNHGPTPGFYPAIMSVAMIVTSIVVFIQSLSQDSPKVFFVGGDEHTDEATLVVGLDYGTGRTILL